MLHNCTASLPKQEAHVRLAEYSRDCLDALRAQTGIEYEGRQQGTTQLFRNQKQLDHAAQDIAVLEQSGGAYELLKPEERARVEPALAAVAHSLTGALHLPNDQTGDSTRLLQPAEQAFEHWVLNSFGLYCAKYP